MAKVSTTESGTAVVLWSLASWAFLIWVIVDEMATPHHWGHAGLHFAASAYCMVKSELAKGR